eukprot:6400061-Amphidinium_carterae.2
MPDDVPVVSREPPRGCDHCQRTHVELDKCCRPNCRQYSCDWCKYTESRFAHVCFTCSMKEHIMQQGDPQRFDAPCARLCVVTGDPLPTVLENQVMYEQDHVFQTEITPYAGMTPTLATNPCNNLPKVGLNISNNVTLWELPKDWG